MYFPPDSPATGKVRHHQRDCHLLLLVVKPGRLVDRSCHEWGDAGSCRDQVVLGGGVPRTGVCFPGSGSCAPSVWPACSQYRQESEVKRLRPSVEDSCAPPRCIGSSTRGPGSTDGGHSCLRGSEERGRARERREVELLLLLSLVSV